MTQDEIIEMAKQAGLLDMDFEAGDWEIHELTTFAKLVAAKEREACARVCEHDIGMLGKGESGQFWTDKCAAAIRARGQE